MRPMRAAASCVWLLALQHSTMASLDVLLSLAFQRWVLLVDQVWVIWQWPMVAKGRERNEVCLSAAMVVVSVEMQNVERFLVAVCLDLVSMMD